MINGAQWSCEWCDKTKTISAFAALFSWLQPRYCLVIGEIAGWPHPSCRLSARLAERVANRKAKQVREETLKELRGSSLGEMRGHPLSEPANNPSDMSKDYD